LVRSVLDRIDEYERAKTLFVCSCRVASQGDRARDWLQNTTLSRHSIAGCLEGGVHAESAEDVNQILRLPKTCHVVVYVHGFRQKWKTVGPHGRLLLEPWPKLDHVPSAVIAFLWPSHTRNYPAARAKATEAGRRLRGFLLALRHAGFHSVSIVAHSLGARVALTALSYDNQESTALVCNLVLIGAAVTSDALSLRGEFPRRNVKASHLVVFFSRNDDILSSGSNTALPSVFALGEFFSQRCACDSQCVGLGTLCGASAISVEALGAHGPVDAGAVDECHDVSCEVKGHKPLSWLMCAPVKELINRF